MGNGTYTTYTYNADGQILDLINYAPSGTINSEFEYTYDSRGLVTSMNTLQGLWTYTYDDDGQLTGWTAPDGSYATYQYDAMGNRILVDQNGVTTNYTTNDMNQYTTVGGVTYTYDGNGNLIREQSGSNVTIYGYDAQNQLIAITNGARLADLHVRCPREHGCQHSKRSHHPVHDRSHRPRQHGRSVRRLGEPDRPL